MDIEYEDVWSMVNSQRINSKNFKTDFLVTTFVSSRKSVFFLGCTGGTKADTNGF